MTEHSYFDGIDTSIAGIASLAPGQHPFLTAGLRQIAASVDQATRTFSPSQPAKLVPLLAAGLKQTQLLMQKVSCLQSLRRRKIQHHS